MCDKCSQELKMRDKFHLITFVNHNVLIKRWGCSRYYPFKAACIEIFNFSSSNLMIYIKRLWYISIIQFSYYIFSEGNVLFYWLIFFDNFLLMWVFIFLWIKRIYNATWEKAWKVNILFVRWRMRRWCDFFGISSRNFFKNSVRSKCSPLQIFEGSRITRQI